MNSSHRSSQPHAGSGPHSSGRATNPLVNYEIAGEVRWLDVDLERVVVDVRQTDSHAGAFLGQDVTVDLEAARIDGGLIEHLVPGTAVRVRTRLPRALRGVLPELLSAHSVTVLPAT